MTNYYIDHLYEKYNMTNENGFSKAIELAKQLACPVGYWQLQEIINRVQFIRGNFIANQLNDVEQQIKELIGVLQDYDTQMNTHLSKK